MSGALDGKVIVATGAGRGIGAAAATLFAEEGATVVVADLNGEAAAEVTDKIVSDGATAIAVAFDLGDEESIERLIRTAVDRHGGIDMLFNNAAATHLAGTRDLPISMCDPAVWDETFRINVKGTMLCMKSAVVSMIERGGGSIINVASGAGLTGDVSNPAYGASKAAIIRMTTYAAVEFGARGVRCNAIAPGLIVTEATADTWAAGPMRDIMERQHLPGRLGRPEDVAGAAVFLASDRSAFITGQVLCVDGGVLAHAPYTPDLADLMAGKAGKGPGKGR